MLADVDMEMDPLGAMVHTPGKSLIFYESPPNLEHLAAVKVAARLIAADLTDIFKNCANDFRALRKLRNWAFVLNEYYSSLILSIPRKIHRKISDLMRPITLHLIDWISRHLGLIDELITRLPTEFLLHFVWKWNGDVDYVLTARNLITGGKLCNKEVIKMMCAYCLECELEKMQDLFNVVYPNCPEENIFTRENNNVFYWYCRLNKYSPVVSDDDDRPFERYMLDTGNAFNLMAIDHHLTMLSFNDEESFYDFCQRKLLQFHSFVVKYLITAMEADQQQRLLELIGPERIIQRFVQDSCPHFVVQLWNHVKNSISGEQYVSMMKIILMRRREELDIGLYQEWPEELAVDIWTSTPRHLKQFVFENEDGDFVFEWPLWFKNTDVPSYLMDNPYFRNDTFLLEILKDADAVLRILFWIQEWPRLMLNSRPERLRALLLTCIRDSLSIRQFDRKILVSPTMLGYYERIFEFVNWESIVNFNQFFNIFAPDPIQRAELKTLLVSVKIPRSFISIKRADYRKYVDVLLEFFHDVDQETRTNMICSWFDKLKLNKKIHSNLSGIFDGILLFAERLCDQEHLKIIAKRIPPREEFI